MALTKAGTALVGIAVSAVLLTSCTVTPHTREVPAADTETRRRSSVTPTPEPSTSTEETPVATYTPIRLSFGDTTITGSLWNNAASLSLLGQLPLELEFSDFGGQEKLAPLPEPLNLEGMPPGSAAEPGTVGYYAPGQVLVLYYARVGYYPGIVPIGTFDNVATVRDSPTFTAVLSAAD